jgi:hypothetical protein
MNEQIKQLAIDCYNPYNNFDTEKFAKLIIEECCNVLQTETIRHDGYGYNQGFLHKKIKDHFGVDNE